MISIPALQLATHATLVTQTGERIPLELRDGVLTFDESWSPFVQGQVTAAVDDLAAFDAVTDIRTGDVRLVIDANTSAYRHALANDVNLTELTTGQQVRGEEFDRGWLVEIPGNSGPWAYYERRLRADLTVTARTIDHATGQISLTLASDEALLQDRARVSTTTSTTGATLLDAINRALRPIGAQLGDVQIQVEPSEQTLADFEDGMSGWSANDPRVTAAISTTSPHSGTRSLRTVFNTVTPAAQATPLGLIERVFTDFPTGQSVTVGVWVYTGTARRLQLDIIERSTGLRTYGGDAAPTTGWRQLTNTTYAFSSDVNVYLEDWTGGTTGVVTYIDDITLTRAVYQLRPSQIVLPPGAADWAPGVSHWTYAQNLAQAYGLKLWCDEGRTWRLTRTQEYVREVRDDVDGTGGTTTIELDADGLTALQTTVSRDSGEWFDGAVLTYQWTDAAGTAQSKIDAYALDGATKIKTETIRQPWPGTGTAQQLVQRAQRRGRSAPLAAPIELDAYPGDAVRVSGPALPEQRGRAASVALDLKAGVMNVTPRELETNA